MTNHNHLLGKVAGVDGLKTGFTNGAGYCLAATAERGGRRIIVVVMGSPDSKTRDLKVIELLERGFASQPAPLPTVKTNGPSAVPTQQPAALPTVKTDKAPAAPAGETSTAKEPVLTFRVNPPTKKP
jgi:D-alanyl-D-alanine carboxypeptidase